MAHAAYPDASDLLLALRSLDLFDDDELTDLLAVVDLETLAGAASRQWEEETGWIPFLADAADVTRFFDPAGPNRRPQILGGAYPLELRAGLVALTSVTTGVSATDAGTVQTLDTDFWLTPYNADELSRPWTALEFVVPQWGARRSIQIIGRWGYSATVPDDVFLAILHQGVRLALPEVATRVSGGVRGWKEADASEDYGDGFLLGTSSGAGGNRGGLGGAWADEWKRAVRRYVRPVL